MRRAKSSVMMAACLAAGAFAAPASAATVIESYEFTAVTGGTITNHSGKVTFSYDDADPTILTLLEIDFELNGFVFDLTNTFAETGAADWLVGGTINGGSVLAGTNDFQLSSTNGLYQFSYATAGGGFGFDFSPTVTQVSAVPEPSTWAMLLLGFFAAGGALRSARRRQKLTVTYA